ncbi:MAG: SDR family oxidoreductase [Bdellovibrionota bacterium]|nr:SDR family oxidoreductase [Bdellovibrionota bacterium]
MKIEGKRVIITGAASGIGKALAHAFFEKGASIVLGDLNEKGVMETAKGVQGKGKKIDVSKEDEIKSLIDLANEEYGGVDIFCSNAGVLGEFGLLEITQESWLETLSINTMSHVYAAKHCLPQMLERGSGYLMITSSAAGLLTQIGAAPYSVSKHAALGFAEWVAITYGEKGIGVSCLCPQAVKTAMTEKGAGVAGVDGMIEAEDCALKVIEGIEEEKFLITPHPEVLEYIKRKTSDYDRWIKGMQRLQNQY